jgi:diguanylate cyclase (GGDEF)-like protein/PAS domain S-box-containing protein
VALAVLGGVCALVLPPSVFKVPYAHASLIFPALPVAAAFRVWQRRTAEPTLRGWGWVLIGMLGFFAYEVLWYASYLTGSKALFGIADIANLLFAPFVLVGLLRATSSNGPTSQQRLHLLDAAIVALGAASVVNALATAYGGGIINILESRNVLRIAGPASDLLTLSGLALVWIRRERESIPGWVHGIGIALTFGLVADVYYALPVGDTHPSPWFVEAAWFANWAALGVGATRALRPARTASRPDVVSRLPYIFAAASFAQLAVAVAMDNRNAILASTIMAGVVTALVLLRQIITLRDVAALQGERAEQRADSRMAALVKHGNDLLAILAPDLTMQYLSPSHEWILGVAPSIGLGRSVFFAVYRDDHQLVRECLNRLLSGDAQRESMVVRLRHASGDWRWVEVVASNQIDEPAIQGLVLNSRDITERKQLEEQLLSQALRDPLTGLGNRRLFSDRVAHAVARQRRQHDSVAVILLDLDQFKLVNDTFGHAKGDALLVAVADRLRKVTRTGDTVARLGGDEFAILLQDLSQPDEADATADRVLHAFDAPFQLDGRDVTIGASLGIAWATEGQSVDDLVTDADVAMYAAKHGGRNRTERFSGAMRANIAERHDVEAALRGAFARNEMQIVYQPVVDLVNGRISGAEALLRWQHPELGLLLPSRFISIAEQSDLIVQLGRDVIYRAAGDAARFRDACAASSRLRVAVNLSARQLVSDDLVTDIQSALAAASLTGAALAVELTETMLGSYEQAIVDRLRALRGIGVRIALDDFGTGYSSLSHLRHYPIDVLKVDQSFVSLAPEAGTAGRVARAIVSIGHSLSMRTVAEGVETREQLEKLRAIGCALGQGYLFSRPLPADDFIQLLQTWDADRFAQSPGDPAAPATR